MGWWQVNADTLAGSRFVVSPLAEAVAALKSLHAGQAGDHLPAYRERLRDDPVTAWLVRAAFGRTWNADFLTPTPTGESDRSFETELASIRETTPEAARDDLTVSLGGPIPTLLRRSDLPARTAGLLSWVWTETVLPDWPRRRRIIEADVVARTARLSQGGWAGALDDMRPGMRWLGGSRLQINTHDNPPRQLSDVQLMFVPVTPRWSWVSWDAPHRYAVVYPCSGVLAGDGRAPVPTSLAALLGPARAGVLVLLDTPKSTTQLVALTGQGLGSVGRHLRVLLDAGLVRRRRSGRSVLYYRSRLGDDTVGSSAST